VKAALARRGEDTVGVDELLELDAARRAKTAERDDLRARVNALSKEVGAMFRDGRKDEAAALQDESRAAR
jgi:seryl-tRNA synthetase